MSALRFAAVSYRYPGAAEPALDAVSFDLAPGEFCVVAGESAAGKSTLLRAAAGLVPHFHGGEFAGQVEIAGRDTRDHTAAAIGAVAGTLFQDPETQVVMNTVRAELALPLQNRGLTGAAVARGVEEAALALGIGDLLDRSTHELSGGELQRVALAAALAPRPQVILLDEPTSQLDPVAGDELVWQLRRLNQEWDTAVLLVEHRLERCLAAADRVLVLDRGRLACDADPRGFLEWAAGAAPVLLTPAARLLAGAGLRPPPAGVRQARATLRAHALLAPPVPAPTQGERPAKRWRRRGAQAPEPALALRDVWHELREGPAILRGIDLAVNAGERVALMGRNGAGKSTLLRHAAGLSAPTRGRIQASGRVALLLQSPGAYFLHDRVGDEAPPGALAEVGLSGLEQRHPRDLSGGQRERLALATVLGDGRPPAVLALDEPTRGMDRGAKDALADWLREQARAGMAAIVATHDAEFAARLADRVVLLAEGRVIADGAAREVLSGGFYFATETARILGGEAGALLPDEGAALLRRRLAAVPGVAARAPEVAG